MTGYIPVDNDEDPRNGIHAGLGHDYVFTGDIWGSLSWAARLSDPNPWDSPRHRFRLTAVVNPERMFDTGTGGVVSAEVRPSGPGDEPHNRTMQYEMATSLDVDGIIKPEARADTVEGDNVWLHGSGTTDAEWSVVSEWLGDHELRLRSRVSAADPDSPFAPSVDAQVFVTIDVTNPSSPEFTISGTHDGYPSWDLLVDCEELYHHDSLDDWKAMGGLGWGEKDIPVKTCHAGSCGVNYCGGGPP